MKKLYKKLFSVILTLIVLSLFSVAAFADCYTLYSTDEYKGFQFSFRGNNTADGSANYFGIAEGKTATVEANVWFEIDPQTPAHYVTAYVQLCHKGGLFNLQTIVDTEVQLYPGYIGNSTNSTITSNVYTYSESANITETDDYYVTATVSGASDSYYSTFVVNVNY